MKSRILAVAVALLLTACASTTPQNEAPAIAWTQLGDGTTLLARVLIGPGESCPTIEIDGAGKPMAERSHVMSSVFGRMCQEKLPAADKRALRIVQNGRVLLEQVVTRDPERVLVIGDTGCRVVSYRDQKCQDRAAWPFADIADAGATQQPNLILHLGDYYYRETPCDGPGKNCVPGPYGDRPETWRAEFFTPARNLLAKAPWIFVRGNHEDCKRGGYGWNYYFSDVAEPCPIVNEPQVIGMAGFTVINVDSAHADDPFNRKGMDRNWTKTIERLASTSPSAPLMVVTHDPGYSLIPDPSSREELAGAGGMRKIAEAARAIGRRTLMLAGHVHAFQLAEMPRGITQVVVGNGGAYLDKFPGVAPMAALPLTVEDYRFVEGPADVWRPRLQANIRGSVQTWAQHGFGVLKPRDGLELTMFDVQGRRQFACLLASETTNGPRCR